MRSLSAFARARLGNTQRSSDPTRSVRLRALLPAQPLDEGSHPRIGVAPPLHRPKIIAHRSAEFVKGFSEPIAVSGPDRGEHFQHGEAAQPLGQSKRYPRQLFQCLDFFLAGKARSRLVGRCHQEPSPAVRKLGPSDQSADFVLRSLSAVDQESATCKPVNTDRRPLAPPRPPSERHGVDLSVPRQQGQCLGDGHRQLRARAKPRVRGDRPPDFDRAGRRQPLWGTSAPIVRDDAIDSPLAGSLRQ